MKISNNNLVILSLILIIINASFALANPPLTIDQMKPLGRLTFFESNYEYSYYLPSAFRSELECLPQGSKKYRCFLRIINELNKNELILLSRVGPSNALSDLSYNIVNGIQERMTLKPEFTDPLNEKSIFTKTLRLSDAPYVLSSFLLDNEKAQLLMGTYSKSSLGIYTVSIDLNVTETNFFLSITNSTELKIRLLELEGKRIKSTSINSEIEKLLNNLIIESKGFQNPKTMIYEIILMKFFTKIEGSKYLVKMNEVSQIKDRNLLLLDDSTINNPFLCEINLELNESAIPATYCKRKEDLNNANN